MTCLLLTAPDKILTFMVRLPCRLGCGTLHGVGGMAVIYIGPCTIRQAACRLTSSTGAVLLGRGHNMRA